MCAIVRDELKNPAGGIERFIQSYIPFVDNAIIVDTGSIDGTREKLDELSSQYDNLYIFDRKFKGYADARNYSLEKARTKWILCLDVDELITSENPENSWRDIKLTLKENSDSEVFKLDILNLYPDGNFGNVPCWKYRLFKNKKELKFFNNIWESLNTDSYAKFLSNVKVYHFLPSREALSKKNYDWSNATNNFRKNNSPSKVSGFQEWKEYNPQRDNYF